MDFDFVVVGGGPAGIALAARLVEGKFSVCLVEHGVKPEHNPELNNSINHILHTRSLHHSSFDYDYRTDNPRVNISSGKVLGGSSCINFAIWTRGSKADYDLWASLVGSSEFSWNSIKQCFERAESVISTRRISASPRNTHHWSSTTRSSLEQSGFTDVGDINSGLDMSNSQRIYGELAESIDQDGKRCTANRYLDLIVTPLLSKPGSHTFKLLTNLRVDSVVFEDDHHGSKRALGVHTKLGLIRAKHEVILTAGAIQSPYILLSSGIGPAAHLIERGVPLVHDLPAVGRNLWEHPFVDIWKKLQPDHRKYTVEYLTSLANSAQHLHEWATKKTGLMSGLLYECLAYTSLEKDIILALQGQDSFDPASHPSLLHCSIPHMEHFVHYGHGLSPAPDPEDSSYIAVSCVLLNPCSRGFVEIPPSTSKNDNDSTIDPSSRSSAADPVRHDGLYDPDDDDKYHIQNPDLHQPPDQNLTRSAGNTTPSAQHLPTVQVHQPPQSQSQPPESPRISLNQLNHSLDRTMLITALQRAYEILGTPAWSEFLVDHGEMPSRDELERMIHERITTLWHLGGTCSMETRDVPGVVDNVFRVHGVRNLRVADMSVIPFPLVAHTQAIAYALGEKMAELLVREYV